MRHPDLSRFPQLSTYFTTDKFSIKGYLAFRFARVESVKYLLSTT